MFEVDEVDVCIVSVKLNFLKLNVLSRVLFFF